jgi:hypothetical protein
MAMVKVFKEYEYDVIEAKIITEDNQPPFIFFYDSCNDDVRLGEISYDKDKNEFFADICLPDDHEVHDTCNGDLNECIETVQEFFMEDLPEDLITDYRKLFEEYVLTNIKDL